MKLTSDNKLINHTLARALSVLEVFSENQPVWGVREISRHLKTNPATASRVVSTLQAAGYLEQDPQTLRYSLGPKIVKLASIYARQNPIQEVAHKVFESYSNRFEHNFYLGQIYNFEVVYLTVAEGRGPLRITVPAGGSVPLYATAIGKVLLAYQDMGYQMEYLDHVKLEPFTGKTIVDPQELLAVLKEIREGGFYINHGEYYEDIGAVGMPVFEKNGSVRMAISLSFPRHRLLENKLNLEEIISLAREISSEITQRVYSLVG